MGSHYSIPFDFRPVYTTKDFWHGSGEIDTGAKKVLVKLHLHYNIFTVPEIPCQNFWASVSSLGDMRSSVISKDGRRSLRAVSLKEDVSQSSKLDSENRI